MPLSLSMVRVTSAMPIGLRRAEPLKITSSIASPRSCLALCSPMTQRMASEMFVLPQPLGPTTAVMPLPNDTSVASTNDLKPWRSSLVRNKGRLLPPGAAGVRAASMPGERARDRAGDLVGVLEQERARVEQDALLLDAGDERGPLCPEPSLQGRR